MDPKHHTLEIFFYIPQFQVQFLFCLEKLCEIRFSLFCELCPSRFRRFFLVRHCYSSFLRASHLLGNEFFDFQSSSLQPYLFKGDFQWVFAIPIRLLARPCQNDALAEPNDHCKGNSTARVTGGIRQLPPVLRTWKKYRCCLPPRFKP